MKKVILNSIFLLLILSVSAQTDLSLLGAIEKALENNYDIRIQQMDEQISTLNNNWGTAGRYPSLSISLNSNNKYDFNENDNYTQSQLLGGVNLNWTLFDGFRVNISKQRLDELEKLTKGYTAVLLEGTVQSVVMAYNKVLLEQEKLEVLLVIEQLSNDRFEYEKIRKELGNAVSYEVLQAQNNYLADKSDVLLQQANVKVALRDLSYLMGEDFDDFKLIDALKSDVNNYQLDDLTAAMMARNKNLLNQYINQTIAIKAVGLAKANYAPTLALSAGAQTVNLNKQFDAQGAVNSYSSNLFGNLSLSYNLFNGGVRKRAVQIARIEEEIADVEIEDLKTSLSNQLYNLYDFYDARKSILKLADERLKVAKINLDISDQKLKAGTINSFNYRDVQLSYQNAAIARLNAIYNLIDTNTSILRITGGIVNEN